MSVDARTNLATQQAELVDALVAHGAAPAGFDSERVQAMRKALAAKRRRAVLRAWPGLATALGDRFAETFDAYAADHGLPAKGALADGREFVRFLESRGHAPDGLLLRAFEIDISSGSRYLPGLGFRRLGNGRLVVALRVPGFRVYFFGAR